jgi:hypothetical protein
VGRMLGFPAVTMGAKKHWRSTEERCQEYFAAICGGMMCSWCAEFCYCCDFSIVTKVGEAECLPTKSEPGDWGRPANRN